VTRVLICGGRDYSNWLKLARTLDSLHAEHEFDIVIHGAAPGADTLADSWASSRRIPTRRFIAFWKERGREAGPERNQRMIDEGCPELCIAFPGGRGTADMKRRVVKAGIPLIDLDGERQG